jgi:DNA invertase Pin-like site-specific DNA recombinase
MGMRVLVAGRLSRKVSDRDQTGFDSQERGVIAWCKANGHEVVTTVADFKTGRSGLEARPNLRPWVTDPAKLALFDAIAVLKIDRLTRGNREKTAKLEQWAREHGKALIVTSGSVQFPSEGREGIAWDMMLRLAHDEWLQISERYRRMQQTLRERGSVVGRTSYGYQTALGVNSAGQQIKVMVQDDNEAQVIRDAAEWYLSGASLDDICDRLNAAGRLPRARRDGRQPKWSSKTLSQVLRNEAIVGRRRNGDGWTVKPDDAIIDRSTWRQVITRMDKRATRKGVSPTRSIAMLTSVIKCARCTKNMYRTGTRYYCRTRGCSMFVPLTVADKLVHLAMSQDNHRDVIESVSEADNHQVQKDDVKRDMMDAVSAGRFNLLPALQAEYERLEAMPDEPAQVVRQESDHTVAEAWAAMHSDAQRRVYLIEHGARFIVDRGDDGKPRYSFNGPSHVIHGVDPFVDEA